MQIVHDRVNRLFSAGTDRDLARGLRAEVADPLWLLGRQWQLGEHQGEDASSPIRVNLDVVMTPFDHDEPGDAAALRRTPAEAVLASEPGEWWTVARRVRVGSRLADHPRAGPLIAASERPLELDGLPRPYADIDGSGVDGWRCWQLRDELGLDVDWFDPQPPPDPVDRFDPASFTYDADVGVGSGTLTVRRHPGGPLHWYAADAQDPPAADDGDARAVATLTTPLRYPGAPTARWWEIEQAALDIGGRAPDRAHFGTLLLAELLASHSDDWFTFGIDAAPGHLVELRDVTVTDSFGEVWNLAPPDDGWSLFDVRGLAPGALLLWPTASTPLSGPVLDQVLLGVDEDERRAWAVERRFEGRELPTTQPEQPPPDDDPAAPWRYDPAPPVPHHWHPYPLDGTVAERRYVQGRLADLSGTEAVLAPEPRSGLLRDPRRGADDPVHHIAPFAIPRQGLELRRRHVLARRTDATPVLWRDRRQVPRIDAPALPLTFDRLRCSDAGAGED